MLGVPIGLVFAWLYARRRAVLPLAVVSAMVAVFAVGPLFGLPLIRRYIETPAVLLMLFYGLAVCRLAMLPRGRARTTLDGRRRSSPSRCRSPTCRGTSTQLDNVERRVQRRRRACTRHLQSAAEAPRVRAAFAQLRAADGRRPPPDPVRRASGSTASPARSPPSRAARARWAGCCCCRAAAARRGRIYNRRRSRRSSRRRASCGSTATASWRVFAAPGVALRRSDSRGLDVLHRDRRSSSSSRTPRNSV